MENCMIEEPDYEYPCWECGGFPCSCDEDRERHDEEHSFGCHFPDRCLMPGEHMKSECHDVAMIEAQNAEYEALEIGEDAPF